MERICRLLVKRGLLPNFYDSIFLVQIETLGSHRDKVSDTETRSGRICFDTNRLKSHQLKDKSDSVHTKFGEFLRPYDWLQSAPDGSGYQSRVETWIR